MKLTWGRSNRLLYACAYAKWKYACPENPDPSWDGIVKMANVWMYHCDRSRKRGNNPYYGLSIPERYKP